jgi:type IV secretion system protein VirB9
MPLDTSSSKSLKRLYPSTLRFDYTWDQKKGAALGIQQIWRDDKFTYLRGQFQETPALYELKDGKGSLINYDFANGLYTIPKTVVQGYLSIGKQRVEFKQIKAGS